MKLKLILSIFVIAAFSFAAFAQTSPEIVIKDLYKIQYSSITANKTGIINGKSRKNLDKFFVKSLADLIWKDQTTNLGEVGAIEADPFYDGQDFQIKKFKVYAADIKKSSATVKVTFTNFGEAKTLVYHMSQAGKTWKISDIEYKDGSKFSSWFE